MRSLVIGADGTIGRALIAALRRRGDTVQATSRRPEASASGTLHLDLADPRMEPASLPPADTAYVCAAMARFADCRADPELARQVNVTAPTKLARSLAARGARVVLLSTNAVYDGSAPNVPATRPPSPKTEYGRFKTQAEAEFLSLGERGAVVRLTKVLEPLNPLFVGWIKTLMQGGSVSAFSDMGLAPITMQQTLTALMMAADEPQGGLFQISASSDVTYAGAARRLAELMGVGIDRVAETRAAETTIPPEQIARYSSLDTARLRALGLAAPDPLAVIDEVFRPVIEHTRADKAANA